MAIVPAPKWQKLKQVTQEDALVQKQVNINYFENHFGVLFTVTPKEEKNNNIVTVIPKSHPKAIFATSVNNASMSLALASPEHDRNFCQVGGTSPVTEQVHQAFTKTGYGMCHIFIGRMLST